MTNSARPCYFSLSPPAGNLPALDGLRGVAILLVVLCHATLPFGWRDAGLFTVAGWDAATPLYQGWAGVNLFFVLSGFLIADLLLQKPFDFKKPCAYLWQRFMRIAPAYYAVLMLLFSGLVFAGSAHTTLVQPATRANYFFFMTDYFFPEKYFISWSLGAEVKFYLILPLFLLLLQRFEKNTRYGVLFLFWLAPLIIRHFINADFAHDRETETVYFVFHSIFHRIYDAFCAGIACALIARDKPLLAALKKRKEKIFISGAALLAAFFLTPLGNGYFFKVVSGNYLSLSFGLVLLGALLEAKTSRWLRAEVLGIIAVISYSLYLTHFLVIGPALEATNYLLGTQTGTGAFLVFFSVYSLAASFSALVLYFLVEKPGMKLRALYGKRS